MKIAVNCFRQESCERCAHGYINDVAKKSAPTSVNFTAEMKAVFEEMQEPWGSARRIFHAATWLFSKAPASIQKLAVTQAQLMISREKGPLPENKEMAFEQNAELVERMFDEVEKWLKSLTTISVEFVSRLPDAQAAAQEAEQAATRVEQKRGDKRSKRQSG